MRVEPVAETRATRGSSTNRSATSGPPTTTCDTAAGAPTSAAACAARACDAGAVRTVFSDGFHTTVSPQTRATAAFHAHTATGKLNDVMSPHTPSGCHTSAMRCMGRSDAMVSP